MIEAVQSYAEANIDQPLILFKGTPLRPISYIDLTIFDQATEPGNNSSRQPRGSAKYQLGWILQRGLLGPMT